MQINIYPPLGYYSGTVVGSLTHLILSMYQEHTVGSETSVYRWGNLG
jgi:hypothetical protein